MALATRCPHCQTTFRVAQDQLKLRAGLVRCGACKQIFNGADHLLQPERQSSVPLSPTSDKAVHVAAAPVSPPVSEHQPPAQAPAAPVTVAKPTTTQSHSDIPPQAEEAAAPEKTEPVDFFDLLASPAPTSTDSSDEQESTEPLQNETPDDPLQRITLMDFSEALSEEEEHDASPDATTGAVSTASGIGEQALSNTEKEDEALESAVEAALPPPNPVRAKTLDELRPGFRPAPPAKIVEEEDVPDFVRKGRRKQRLAKTSRLVMGIGSLLLFIGLTIQAAYAFRDALAASSPKMKAILASACQSLGCGIQLPTQIDSIELESSDFQSLPGHDNTLVLTMLLRNQSHTVQAWPQIELTLNDANDKPIARRILPPQDYLPPGQDPKAGFPSRSEQAIKTYLQVSQLKPDGYRLYLFYP